MHRTRTVIICYSTPVLVNEDMSFRTLRADAGCRYGGTERWLCPSCPTFVASQSTIRSSEESCLSLCVPKESGLPIWKWEGE